MAVFLQRYDPAVFDPVLTDFQVLAEMNSPQTPKALNPLLYPKPWPFPIEESLLALTNVVLPERVLAVFLGRAGPAR